MVLIEPFHAIKLITCQYDDQIWEEFINTENLYGYKSKHTDQKNSDQYRRR